MPSTVLGPGEIAAPKTDRGEMEPNVRCVGEGLSRQKSGLCKGPGFGGGVVENPALSEKLRDRCG